MTGFMIDTYQTQVPAPSRADSRCEMLLNTVQAVRVARLHCDCFPQCSTPQFSHVICLFPDVSLSSRHSNTSFQSSGDKNSVPYESAWYQS